MSKITSYEAEQAIITLLKFIGENPEREGLLETPKRVIRAYQSFFRGYHEDPKEILNKTFEDVHGYEEIVLLKNMRLESYCEHHMVPIIGTAHVAYLPSKKVVGISKIARVVDTYAKRLQTQERLTSQIAHTIQQALSPQGVGVIITSQHQCITTRGVHKPGTETITSCMLGKFKEDSNRRTELMTLIQMSS